jgi:hypothetical protein
MASGKFNPMAMLSQMMGGGNGGSGSRGGGMAMGGGGGAIDPTEKRKLITELKDEMKPIINQIAAKVSEKHLNPIKNSMKALEKDLIINVETLKAEIKAGDARVKTFSQKLNDILLERLEDEVGLLRKTIVRNKSDFDMKYIETCEQQKVTRDALNRFQEYFNSLAGISAYLVENVNM